MTTTAQHIIHAHEIHSSDTLVVGVNSRFTVQAIRPTANGYMRVRIHPEGDPSMAEVVDMPQGDILVVERIYA